MPDKNLDRIRKFNKIEYTRRQCLQDLKRIEQGELDKIRLPIPVLKLEYPEKLFNIRYRRNKKMVYSIYYLVCDTEIIFMGKKKECVNHYKSLPNPMPMKLIKAHDQWYLNKNGRFIQIDKCHI